MPRNSQTERKRKWRQAKREARERDAHERIKKPKKTATQRSREYRERLKAAAAKQQSNTPIELLPGPMEETQKPKKTAAQRSREYRECLKTAAAKQQSNTLIELLPGPKEKTQLSTRYVDSSPAATKEFKRSFVHQEFGFACNVCDRLWFKNDLHSVSQKHIATLRDAFPDEDVSSFQACLTCRATLATMRIPLLATCNGFMYPAKPNHLPPLNAITERLISPHLPFIQIRRLRYENGTHMMVGQIINVPMDVGDMVYSLPRTLSDDHTLNVSLKKNLIHKSLAFAGLVEKQDIRAWLDYLQTTPLYKQYKITIDWTALNSEIDNETEATDEQLDSIDANNDCELLLAKQQTLLWSEEKYLDIVPGQRNQLLNIIHDEYAEEFAFPSIYYGHPRLFKPGMKVSPFKMATSEIRRSDRRGVSPQHILYMAMKILRLRVAKGLYATFRYHGNNSKVTREMIEDKQFLEKCVQDGLSFHQSIPNSVQYWNQRKSDLFAMIRQLGKPTCFLTLSANEIRWPHLLKILYRISGKTDAGNPNQIDDYLNQLSASFRSSLVNEDPVTCCIYFEKLVQTIMHLLQSQKFNPFGADNRIMDYFLRIEFQHRGSPHAHIMIWLLGDPKEDLSESMPGTVRLIDKLCSVNVKRDFQDQYYSSVQVHRHTPTCYKNKDNEGTCQFNIPYWPMRETRILLPLPKDHGCRKQYRKKAIDMCKSLEFKSYNTIDEFLHEFSLSDLQYLNIIRASISCPTVVFKRDMCDIWTNTFNPWIANVLKSNMDLQFILDEYSCASYVVEYVNKSNRGISNLHHQLCELQDEYPDQDYTVLLKRVSLKMLDAVEMTTQEAAWYLLQQSMSEASRKVVYIPTVLPGERMRSLKKRKQMDLEELPADSTDVCAKNIIEKYEDRPNKLKEYCLADFAAKLIAERGKTTADGKQSYRIRDKACVLRWFQYEPSDEVNFKRSLVLLYWPFVNEHADLLDDDKFLNIYDTHQEIINERRWFYEKYLDLDKAVEEYELKCRNKIDSEETSEDEQQVFNVEQQL